MPAKNLDQLFRRSRNVVNDCPEVGAAGNDIVELHLPDCCCRRVNKAWRGSPQQFEYLQSPAAGRRRRFSSQAAGEYARSPETRRLGRLAPARRSIEARCKESRLVATLPAAKSPDWPPAAHVPEQPQAHGGADEPERRELWRSALAIGCQFR